jgi:hypothetical protein
LRTVAARESNFGRFSFLERGPGKVPAKKVFLEMLEFDCMRNQTRNPTVHMPSLSSNFGRIFFRNYTIFCVT